MNWEWKKELPLVALISLVTSPFGWFWDFVITVPLLIQVATKICKQHSPRRWLEAVGDHLFLNLLAVVLIAIGVAHVYLFFFPVMILLFYFRVRFQWLSWEED